MPRARHPCPEPGCTRTIDTRSQFCFLHSPGGGRKASDWLLDIDVATTLGEARHVGPMSYRVFCMMCARDFYSNVIPGGGQRKLECGVCGGRVFVEAEDLKPYSWYTSGLQQRQNYGHTQPARLTLSAREGDTE